MSHEPKRAGRAAPISPVLQAHGPEPADPTSHTDEGLIGWMAVSRLLFGALLLTWWRPADISSLSDIPKDLWFAPLGPFALLEGPPPAWFLDGLRLATLGLLVLLLVGWRTRAVSYTLSAAFIVAAGLRFSTGKVDHDLVLWLVPAILAGSWGCRLAIRPEPNRTPRLDLLAVVLGVTFLTSGLSKALSGWLSPSYSAVEGWAGGYVHAYGWTHPIATRALEWPIPWELLDIATVLIECGLIVFLTSRRTLSVAVSAAALFNLGVILLTGIDFSQLALVYVPLLALSVRVPRRLTGPVAGLVVIGLALASVAALYPTRWVVSVGVLSAAAAVGVYATRATWSGWLLTPRRAVALTLALLTTYPLVLVHAEPFPAVTGPLFLGDGPDSRQEWRKADQHVTPGEALGVDERWATNIGWAGWPSTERGHEIGRLWYHPRPVLPRSVSVRWVRIPGGGSATG